jgi:hypothetical protein
MVCLSPRRQLLERDSGWLSDSIFEAGLFGGAEDEIRRASSWTNLCGGGTDAGFGGEDMSVEFIAEAAEKRLGYRILRVLLLYQTRPRSRTVTCDRDALSLYHHHARWLVYIRASFAPNCTTTLASGSQSSDYFEDEDPAFIDALEAAVLPGDVANDRTDFPAPENNRESDSDDPEPPPPGQPQPSLKRRRHEGPDPVDETIYGAAEFGDFGQYMKRKRAKLQIQNSEINTAAAATQIFKGVTVYVCEIIEWCFGSA